MRIETIPLVVGAIVALVGLALLFDAWAPDHIVVRTERRRRPRAERHRGGEAALGLGVLCMAAALLGRDSWRYSIIAALAGAALLVAGALLNRRLLGDILTNRGPLRRAKPGERVPAFATRPSEVPSVAAGGVVTPPAASPNGQATPQPPSADRPSRRDRIR